MPTTDPGQAAAGAGTGRRVVLIVAEGAERPTGVPEPVALCVGDAADPTTWRAAEEMEAELDPHRAGPAGGR